MRSLIPTVSWPLLAAMSVSASHPARAAPDVTPLSGSTSPAPQPIEMRKWSGAPGTASFSISGPRFEAT